MKWTLAVVALLMAGLSWAQDSALSPTAHRTVPTERPSENIALGASYTMEPGPGYDLCSDSGDAFRYTCCPKSNADTAADMRILKGVAAAYQFTGEERFKRILLAGVETAIKGTQLRPHRGVGKSICFPMRGALQVIASLPVA